jgi:geranylgeranyl diphosphate synthase type 3
LRYAATTWSPAKESILLGPYTYLFSHPGKDIRAQLISAFNAWLCVPPAALEIITRVVGMLHTASLLVDDVEDSSLLRRGLPVAHSIFGTAQTINSANYVYFEALQELLKLDELKDGAEGVSGRRRGEAVRIYTEELVNLHRGQGMDLFWRDTLTVPSEEDYLEMVGNKTGGLFRLAVRLMQAESASDRYVILLSPIFPSHPSPKTQDSRPLTSVPATASPSSPSSAPSSKSATTTSTSSPHPTPPTKASARI